MDIRMDSLHVSGHSLQHIGVVRLVYEMEPKLKGAIHLGIEGKYKLQIEFQVFLASLTLHTEITMKSFSLQLSNRRMGGSFLPKTTASLGLSTLDMSSVCLGIETLTKLLVHGKLKPTKHPSGIATRNRNRCI